MPGPRLGAPCLFTLESPVGELEGSALTARLSGPTDDDLRGGVSSWLFANGSPTNPPKRPSKERRLRVDLPPSSLAGEGKLPGFS